MIETFERDGVGFQYPANWELDVEDEDGGWTATLQSPATAVIIFTYSSDGEPAELADDVLDAFQDDYEELDSEIAVEKLAGRTALGHDLDLLTLDTPVIARIRAIPSGEGALLLVSQFSEPERAHYEPLLAAVLASLSVR